MNLDTKFSNKPIEIKSSRGLIFCVNSIRDVVNMSKEEYDSLNVELYHIVNSAQKSKIDSLYKSLELAEKAIAKLNAEIFNEISLYEVYKQLFEKLFVNEENKKFIKNSRIEKIEAIENRKKMKKEAQRKKNAIAKLEAKIKEIKKLQEQ